MSIGGSNFASGSEQVLPPLLFRGEALLKLDEILGEIFGHPQPLRVGPT